MASVLGFGGLGVRLIEDVTADGFHEIERAVRPFGSDSNVDGVSWITFRTAGDLVHSNDIDGDVIAPGCISEPAMKPRTSAPSTNRRHRTDRSRSPRLFPRVEPLEDRTLLSIVLQDNFNDNALDPLKWTVNTNIQRGPASVTETNQHIEFRNRGHLTTVGEFDPASVGPLEITGTWTFTNTGLPAGDFMQVLTRSDGVPTGATSETQNGIEFIADSNGGALGLTQRVNGVATPLKSVPMSINANEPYTFDARDDGTNLTFTFHEVGGNQTSAIVSAASSLHFATNHVVFHDREANNGSNTLSYLDDVTIAAQVATPATPSGLSAVANSPSSIALTWNTTSGASGYKLERASSSTGPWVPIAQPTSPSYTDDNTAVVHIQANTTYFYHVAATDFAGDSAFSPAVSATTPVIAEFGGLTTHSDPSGIATGSDGNLWFTEFSASNVGRITPNGVVTELPVGGPGGLGITLGPDGNIWFIGGGDDTIGKITPTGVVTKYTGLKKADSGFGANPNFITVGQDSNLWFTEFNANRIGRITPNGVITEFPIPTSDSHPGGITKGPDNGLWFTENTADKIGRIDPFSGSITEYGGIPAGSHPQAIVTGPDGNLWFTEHSSSRIGRLTPSGILTEFAVPTVNPQINNITRGPDGNLWFSETATNKIGRITPVGVVTEYPTPSLNSGPDGITTGPDGNIWFAEGNLDKIGRFTIAVSVPTNHPPIAADDTASTTEGTPIAIHVLDNDADADNDPLTITIVSQPSFGTGTATVNDNGTPGNPNDDFITFTPAAGLGAGAYHFTYKVNDGKADSNLASVTVTVVAQATPTGLNAIANSASSIAIGWNSSIGATRYKLERSTSASGPWTPIASPISTNYTDDNSSVIQIQPNTTYFYHVAASSSGGDSPFSLPVSVTTPASSPYVVITTSDNGDNTNPISGSLRAAILYANAIIGPNTINFQISSGAVTISPLRALPTITEAVTIDATTQPGYDGTPLVELNGINAGTGVSGLTISASGSTVQGLLINRFLAFGIDIDSASATNNVIRGNYLGTDPTGTSDRGNGLSGVGITNGTAFNTIGGTVAGAGNTIAFNGQDGVLVASGANNAILSNSIFGNGGLGIDLGANGVTPNDPGDGDTGANNLQNFPLLNLVTAKGSSTEIFGTLNSTPTSSFRIEIYSSTSPDPSGFGEGQVLLASTTVTTDANGNAAIDVIVPVPIPIGTSVTAIATDSSGNSSEFSPGQTVVDQLITPAQIRKAYGFDRLSWDGTGQTIAIVDAYDNPRLLNSTDPNFASSDLARFDTAFGLSDPPSFIKMNQEGQIIGAGGSQPPPEDKTGIWETEEVMDVEWAHALAPKARIILIETMSNSTLYKGVTTALGISEVSIVSMSFSTYEMSIPDNINDIFMSQNHHNITFLASSGDHSAPGGFPAFSPYVIAVGGTSLYLNLDDGYDHEVGWNSSGGGTSKLFKEPPYQTQVQDTGTRTIPDVAFDADIATGPYIYDSYNAAKNNVNPWTTPGSGTSLGTPCWAALIALVNQGRVAAGGTILDGPTQSLFAIYDMPRIDFNSDLGGSNGTNPGDLLEPTRYDEVTGLGTPRADLLVPHLIAWNPLSLSPGTLPAGTVNTPYSQVLIASGGTGNKLLTITAPSGNLPAGLIFNTKTNELDISGMPTAVGSTTIVVMVTDGNGLTSSVSYTLTINAKDVTGQLSYATSGLVYNRATQLFGGSMTFTNTGTTTLTGTVQVVFTGLPPGVTLANASGYTMDGNPYITMTLPSGALAPGQAFSFTTLFSNPKKLPFMYGLSIFDVYSTV